MIKPFTPDEAKGGKVTTLPPEVIEVFNHLLAERYSSHIEISQPEVVGLILSKMPNVKRQEIFDKNWLDVEEVYDQYGWDVDYDKPGYNETYEATWTFTKKRK